MQSRHREQPLDFREDEVRYIMDRWRGPTSISIVGIGAVGKSNLIQHLSEVRVQQEYMDKDTTADNFRAILIDPNMLGPLPTDTPNAEQFRCWAGYELMMHRLYMNFHPLDILGPDYRRQFHETYQQLQDGTNPLHAYMGLRYFELGLEFFMRRGIKLIFMFDEFEEMLQALPVKFFQTLRGIRDANKRNLSYVTFSRSPLPTLIDRYKIPTLEIEPFAELFTDNLLYIGPYNHRDALRMIEELMQRTEKNYHDDVINFLLYATGRYAGLLRAAFNVIDRIVGRYVAEEQYDAYTEKLATFAAIRAECRVIWLSLNQSERAVLKTVVGASSQLSPEETEEAITMLVKKQLLQVDRMQKGLHINPPVFREYIASNANAE